MDTLLTIHQVAQHCQVTPDTVRRWIRERRLTSTRIGTRHLRVSEIALQEFLAQTNEPVP